MILASFVVAMLSNNVFAAEAKHYEKDGHIYVEVTCYTADGKAVKGYSGIWQGMPADNGCPKGSSATFKQTTKLCNGAYIPYQNTCTEKVILNQKVSVGGIKAGAPSGIGAPAQAPKIGH